MTDQQQLLRDRGICVIIPTYNNAGTIADVVQRSLLQCSDVIVVCDGCTDNTLEILNGLKERPCIVELKKNSGKGAALKAGFRYALEKGFAYAITLDGDAQHYPEDIPVLLAANQKHPGALIVGERKGLDAADRSSGSKFANSFSNFWFALQTGRYLKDTQTGYRLYPLKKCDGKPKDVCLYYHINECLGYCCKNIDQDKVDAMEKEILSFLNGNDDIIVNKAESTVYISDDEMSIDVGAIAKGYAAEKIAKWMIGKEYYGYVINIGGNVRTIKRDDGEKWKVGIENPDTEDTENPYIETLKFDEMSLVTSGSYQRFYTVDGKNYHHIIDSETLMPAQNFKSVSVICADSGVADALSTTLFCMSYEEGLELLEHCLDTEVMWVLPSGERLYTDGFKKYCEQ